MLPIIEMRLKNPQSLMTKNATGRLPGNGSLLSFFTGNATLGKAESTVKQFYIRLKTESADTW